MKKKQVLSCLLVLVLAGCAAQPSKGLIKNELKGKPLTSDDFTFIVGDKVVNAFYPQAKLTNLFPVATRTENKLWSWSVLYPENPHGLPNTDYTTNGIRFVYLGNPRAQEDANEYAGLGKGPLTIRGIGIGDPTSKVLEIYGKNDWVEQHAGKINTGGLGFDYRFYGYAESAQNKYPFYDFIEFESKDGTIVGIHFWRKQSDAQ
jgi:hypothetical protein